VFAVITAVVLPIEAAGLVRLTAMAAAPTALAVPIPRVIPDTQARPLLRASWWAAREEGDLSRVAPRQPAGR